MYGSILHNYYIPYNKILSSYFNVQILLSKYIHSTSCKKVRYTSEYSV